MTIKGQDWYEEKDKFFQLILLHMYSMLLFAIKKTQSN
jgi:hypothetical protein